MSTTMKTSSNEIPLTVADIMNVCCKGEEKMANNIVRKDVPVRVQNFSIEITDS